MGYCSITGNIEIAKFLVEKEAHLHEPNDNDLTAFHLAILYGHFFLFCYYMTLPSVESYLNNSENSYKTLKVACKIGCVEVFRLVGKYVTNWAYSGKDSYTIFHYVCGCGFAQIYDEAMRKCQELVNSNSNNTLETPLHWAVVNQNIEIVKKLVAIKEVDIDVKNSVRVIY